MCFFVSAWTYALCVNFVPSYRDPADKFSTTQVGIEDLGRKEDEESGSPVSGERVEKSEKSQAEYVDNTTPEIQKM